MFVNLHVRLVIAMDKLSRLLYPQEYLKKYYTYITQTSLTLIKWQIKADWIGIGYDCTRFFLARAKQKKMATYICTLQDHNGNRAEDLENEGSLPSRHLGVPITASQLSNIECKSLVEKITTRIKIWSSKNISYTRRIVLINLVLLVSLIHGHPYSYCLKKKLTK
ncbi:hypothetical protein Cgig2_012277 [Carnegiea gigantea]|uniref:Uncharacterized protein n=1 Tax=Carnegiea gigantea TaxID=171969 RepID=A0A9Q1K2M1_9CARY|nr:hypothetical protein Cgig2_012277 [Carnegiea gigantea]